LRACYSSTSLTSHTISMPSEATRAIAATSIVTRRAIAFAVMAGIIGPSALAFGVMSEKRLAIFAVSALGFVAAVLVRKFRGEWAGDRIRRSRAL
jgi:hypothetical protein